MKRIFCQTAAALCLVASLQVTAAPIVLDYEGFVGNNYKTGDIGGQRSVRVNAGQFDFDVVHDYGDIYWSDTLQAFCIDVMKNLVTSTNGIYDLVDGASYLTPGQIGLLGALYKAHAQDLGSATTDAAFQLAIWEIIYDFQGTLSLALNAGNFWASGFNGALGLAQSWLDALVPTTASGYEFFVLKPNAQMPNNQALLVARQVPEPAVIVLLAAGLLAMGAVRRGRRAAQA